jgi:hypothetical protein
MPEYSQVTSATVEGVGEMCSRMDVTERENFCTALAFFNAFLEYAHSQAVQSEELEECDRKQVEAFCRAIDSSHQQDN